MIAEANGIAIHYQQEGTGPDLVLIPGLGASAYAWHGQLKGLSSMLRVTAIDPRGHGRSAKPPGPYTMRGMADDVAACMRSAGISRAVVAGSSMASLIGVELAAAYPERVSALILVGGFAALPAAGKERMEARARTAETEGMTPLGDLVSTTALGTTTHATQPGLVGLFRHLIASNDPAGYAASCRALVQADVTPLLGQVRCPTLILLGSEEQVAPLPAARALKAGIPHAEVAVLPGAGHLPFLEQPAAFNAAVLEFVAGLPKEQA
jgi:pimeloyl-ACP methyl ester carboxylesterase